MTAVIQTDNSATKPNVISAYMHCRKCLEELPYGESPKSWARTQTGISADGTTLQVWCNRHEVNVASFTMKENVIDDPICDLCGEPLTVEGLGGDEPQHIFCDICGKAEHPADLTPDWNGDTGAHRTCEVNQ